MLRKADVDELIRVKYYGHDGSSYTVAPGNFPIMAFNTTIYVADKESNSLINIASYNNETLDGERLYEKFERCKDIKKDIKNEAIRNKIITEEGIII